MTQLTPAKPVRPLYRVGKTIRYLNPHHPLADQIVKPGTKKADLAETYPDLEPKRILAIKDFAEDGELLLPFGHLNERDMQVLLRTKTLIPAA
jgi:hypothetical protein